MMQDLRQLYYLKRYFVADIGKEGLEEIISGCTRRAAKSQELLYRQFFGYALSVAVIYSKNREEATEIVNDSFIKVFSEIGKFDVNLPFKGWLRKIVINTAIDRFRKHHKFLTFYEPETFLIPDENPGIISHLTAQDILNLLNRLPEIQKMVFQLYELEGYSHDQIASMLRIPESTSRVYLTRAKKKLRELFPAYFTLNYEKFGN
jgi:RNA polymerase sigma-70 factor (ECF subfamily)